jgi:hypothetical protein
MVKLVNFLKSADFRKEDLADFDVKRETTQFDAYLKNPSDFDPNSGASFSTPKDGWQEVEVDIQVPDGQAHGSESDIPIFSVPGLHYRSLTEVIKSAFHDTTARCFHYTPFKQFWSPSDGQSQRICDELYTSDAMIDAHVEIQRQPPEPGCTLERVVAGLMFWSDSTHLASFGDASLWPIYLFFGNQSKWLRGKPRTASCHHLAYIPKVWSNSTPYGSTEDILLFSCSYLMVSMIFSSRSLEKHPALKSCQ